MRINSITLKNFKGHTGSYTLAPFNLLHGANWSGKTRIVDAISVLLSGFHPKLGKRNADVMALASGNEMQVSGVIDGQSYWREFKRQGDSVRATCSTNCSGLSIPNVLLDAREYFALSDRERVKYVFGMVPMPGDAEMANKIVAEVKNHQFENNTAQTQKALIHIAARIMEFWDHEVTLSTSVQMTLEGLVSRLKADKSDTDAAIKRMTGAVGASTELATTQLPDQTQALNAARARQEELVRQIEQIQAQQRQEAQRQQKVAQLTGSIMKLKVQLQPEAVAALEEQIRQLELPRPAEVQATELQAKQTKLSEISMVQRALARTIQTLENIIREAESIEKNRAAYENFINDAAAKAAGIEELEKQHAKADRIWKRYLLASRLKPEDKALVERAAPYCPDELKIALETMAASAVEPKEKPDKLLAELTLKRSAKNNVEQFSKDMSELPACGALPEARATLGQNRTKLLELDKQQAQVQQEHAQLQANLLMQREHDGKLASAKDALARTSGLRGQLEQMETQLWHESQAAPVPDIEPLNIQKAASQLSISVLETKQRQYVAQLGEQAQAAKALEKRQELEAQSHALKAAVQIVEAEQAALVEQAFTGILATANRITSGILRGPIVYRDGTIGIGGKTFASNKTVSGTEEVLLYAALSLSLAAQSPLKLLLIDEMGRLDAVNKAKVAMRIKNLIVDGTLDQAVLIDVDPKGYEQVDGLNILSL